MIEVVRDIPGTSSSKSLSQALLLKDSLWESIRVRVSGFETFALGDLSLGCRTMCWTDIFPNPDSDFDGGVASKKWYDENDIDITGESYRMDTDPKALCKVDINRRVFQHFPYAGAPCYDTVQVRRTRWA